MFKVHQQIDYGFYREESGAIDLTGTLCADRTLFEKDGTYVYLPNIEHQYHGSVIYIQYEHLLKDLADAVHLFCICPNR